MDTIMLEMYDVLFKLRYPEITKAKPDNIGSTILSGENRIHLLSWLLTEKLPTLSIELGKLQGPVLEDKLAKYYSQLGICVDKDILLGNCTLEKQFSTLARLLKFIKKIHADSNDVSTNKEEQTVANLLKMHFAEDTDNLNNASLKMSYSEAVKYFEELRILDEPNEFDKTSIGEELSEFNENGEEANNTEEQKNFILRMEKLTDTYNSISSCFVSAEKDENPAVNCMDEYFKTMQSDFEIFKQILHFKNEIPTLALPKTPEKINLNKQSFNSIIEDIMISTDDIKYMC
ncbi:PREDICTED: uncharacterized protein LOC106785559 [Polistes canadensis]|uniref:uncharacterized protein LOC106785559 n=1 Tax=Polistes canadensis TaxID=91411 RepID=UPI000718D4D4|nr:PREDICTED: uncharacterized protein LOC106785559 [Polistes canadensis]